MCLVWGGKDQQRQGKALPNLSSDFQSRKSQQRWPGTRWERSACRENWRTSQDSLIHHPYYLHSCLCSICSNFNPSSNSKVLRWIQENITKLTETLLKDVDANCPPRRWKALVSQGWYHGDCIPYSQFHSSKANMHSPQIITLWLRYFLLYKCESILGHSVFHLQ